MSLESFMAMVRLGMLGQVFLLSSIVGFSIPIETASAQMRYHVGCDSNECIVGPWGATAAPMEFNIRQWPIEATTPFLSEEEVAGYRKAMTKYPSAESCLTKDATTPEGIDLREVDWAKFNNHYSIYVCFFRIGTVISDEDKVNKWLQSIGFASMIWRPRNPTWARVGGTWQGPGRSPFVTPQMWLWTKISYKRFSVSFELDEKRQVSYVNFGFPNRFSE